jgi:hypothetical protein
MTQIPEKGATIRFRRPVVFGHAIDITATVEDIYKGEPVQIKFFGIPGYVAITNETQIEEIKQNG